MFCTTLGKKKTEEILVVLLRLGERIAKILQNPAWDKQDQGKTQNSWTVFWRVAAYKITNVNIDLSAVLLASNKSLNSDTFSWIYYFYINNTEKHRSDV